MILSLLLLLLLLLLILVLFLPQTYTNTHTHTPLSRCMYFTQILPIWGLPYLATPNLIIWGLLRWLSGKESVCHCRRCGFDPWARKIPWSRKWQHIPVFLPGKFHGERSLLGYSPWRCKELDKTEQLSSRSRLVIYYISLVSQLLLLWVYTVPCSDFIFSTCPLIFGNMNEALECVLWECCYLVAQLYLTFLQCHGLYPSRLFCPWAFPGKNTTRGCHFLLQRIFTTQELNLSLLYCRQILYDWVTLEAHLWAK